MSDITVTKPRSKWQLQLWIPLTLFITLAVLLAFGLTRDPRLVPSPLIGKPVPEFNLPPVRGRELGLANTHLMGKVSLVNVFASWCAACRNEHPLLMKLAASDTVPIHGLNYKDKPDDAERWLDKLGDPYTRTGADINGRVGIEWGVYGVPETYIIDQEGKIAYKHIGAINQNHWESILQPLIQQLRRDPQ